MPSPLEHSSSPIRDRRIPNHNRWIDMHERELFGTTGLGICIDAAIASPLCPVNYSIWPVWQEETKINRGGLQHNVAILFLLSFFPSGRKKSALAIDTHPRFFGGGGSSHVRPCHCWGLIGLHLSHLQYNMYGHTHHGDTARTGWQLTDSSYVSLWCRCGLGRGQSFSC